VRPLDELLLFYPKKFPDGDWEPDWLQYEDIWFPSVDGTEIHGWYCPAPEPRAVVLYAHGNGGNVAYRAKRLQRLQTDMGCSVLIFDYRGYGRSHGRPSVKGILADAEAARHKLAQLAQVDLGDIVLLGRSLGGAVATQLAAHSPARGLILESTFCSLRTVARHHYPKLSWLVKRQKLNSIELIKQHQRPLLISHGDADEIVPYQLGCDLFEAANDPKQLITIPGGLHNDPHPDDYYVALDAFLKELE